MKLYDLRTGVSTRRVRIFLAEKGVVIPKVEVDMNAGENRRPDYLAKNPMGTMPVLELDDGTFLSESMAICRYVEEEIAPEPNLFGVGARERAGIEMWNRRAEIELLLPAISAFQHLSPFWKDLRIQIEAAGTLARGYALERMRWLNEELATREYIAGDRFTVADITSQCALVLAKNTGLPPPSEMQHLLRWFGQVSTRPTARA